MTVLPTKKSKIEKCKAALPYLLVGLIFLTELVIFCFFGENNFIEVHDNLDLFVPHLTMLKETGTFFSQGATLPILGGVSRDCFGSEWNLYNLLFLWFSPFNAYLVGYFLKILIAFFSGLFLARVCFGEKTVNYTAIIVYTSFAYGLIPVFPAYGIAFASIPLIVGLLIKIMREPKWYLYVILFFYPFVSYFSYFGFFILAYMVLSVIILWIKDKKLNKALLLSIPVLAMGYATLEYRLFREMLFSKEVTIRSTMVVGDLGVNEIVSFIKEDFINGVFHAQSSHTKWILPVVLVTLIILFIQAARKKQWKRFFCTPLLWIVFGILFNSTIYGLYYWKAFRNLVETICPPLTGFQFSRTNFFNPFLWYLAIFCVAKLLIDSKDKWKKIMASFLVIIAIGVVIRVPAMYNDFYTTCYNNAYKILKQKEVSKLTYQEFYSENLFAQIKEDINYQGEWSVAYGMHPGILTYNGISTLDGYLGFYSQEYKERFRRMIAPALEKRADNKAYFDEWGARAYLFTGAEDFTYAPVRVLNSSDHTLSMDAEGFRELGGVYLFSRIEISNFQELGLELVDVYEDKYSPYTIYLYQNVE